MDYEQTKKHISNLIYQKVIIEKVVSQAELSRRLGVSKPAIGKWINNGVCPEASRVPELCEIFGITIYEFFGIENIEANRNNNYIDAIEKHPELKAILDKYTDAN
ncbi:MAG: helix-turn-helix transcriptional regulator [Acholeplasmatales bacterium]|nr:helix-turn-helix transcriptional regulator [Acholeplasmatales bacterium]